MTQTRKTVDPSLSDLIKLAKKDIMLSMNCHAIATINSFDSSKQTVNASIAYKKTYNQRGVDGVYREILVDYPQLLDVPVVILSGGGSCLTFPIVAGDTCLILFNDRDLDNWFHSGQITEVATSRLHSFSDAIAIVGLRAGNNPHTPYDTTRATLKGTGEAAVGVGATKVKVYNDTTTLNTLLQDLIDQIKLITVTCATPGNPSGVPLNAAALTAIATQIEGLLE